MAEHTIEYDRAYEKWKVYEWGIYERSSVLAGQNRKRFVDWFPTEAAAKAAFPDADTGYRDANNSVAHLPGENDPVPGGMYPDDIGGSCCGGTGCYICEGD